MIDLTKNKEKFLEYTLKWTLRVELLLENHLSELIALEKYAKNINELKKKAEELMFCQECVANHALELSGYASECITGDCPNPSAWNELFKLCDEMYDYFAPLTKLEDYTQEVFDKAKRYDFKLRSLRKRLESGNGYRGEIIGVKENKNNGKVMKGEIIS